MLAGSGEKGIGPGQRAGLEGLRIKRWPVDLFLPNKRRPNLIMVLIIDVGGGGGGGGGRGLGVGGFGGSGLVVGGGGSGGLMVGLLHPDGGFKLL